MTDQWEGADTASDDHRFVRYIDRSRAYYAHKGFTTPYRWATNSDVAFASLAKPLTECRIGIVTTAARTAAETDGPAYAASLDDAPAAAGDHLFWHRKATHLDDHETFLPVGAVQALGAAGRVSDLAPRFYGVPTVYSHRQTRTVDAPAVLDFCRDDDVDVVVLVPI